MDNNKKDNTPNDIDTSKESIADNTDSASVEPSDKTQTGEKPEPAPPKPEPNPYLKERLYDKIPFSIKTLDKIIFILFVLLLLAFIIGVLKGNGISW